jgi:hypothetical protein
MMQDISALQKLREPFKENQISQLPKPMKRREEMDKLPKATCKICGGYHATSMMLHLSYVGHAALTDRLLDVDPAWSWEPLAVGADGYPVIDKDGGMWIKLTVCGVTRLGYGDAQGKSGGDAMKERIGDALRNAAMRFGAALDLWHKGELHVDESDGNQPAGNGRQPPKSPPQAPTSPTVNGKATQAEMNKLREVMEQAGYTVPQHRSNFIAKHAEGKKPGELTGADVAKMIEIINARQPGEEG